MELLHSIRADGPATPVVMITGNGSEALAVEAFHKGANDYVVRGEHSTAIWPKRSQACASLLPTWSSWMCVCQ